MCKAYINCIGVDERKHVCAVDEDETACGIPIAHKGLKSRDHARYSCYECDAVMEKAYE